MQLFPSNRSTTIGTASTRVLFANNNRVHAVIQNTHATAKVYIQLGADAVTANGIYLAPGGGAYEISLSNPWPGDVYAISDTVSTGLGITEVSGYAS